jgi:hypothetical protein
LLLPCTSAKQWSPFASDKCPNPLVLTFNMLMIDGRIFSYSLSPIRLLKKLHNHHSNLIGKLTNREVLITFNPVIKHLGYVVCDVVTLDGRVETTSIP